MGSLVAAALFASAAAAGPGKPAYWSEAKAERLVVKKARIACATVRKRSRCDVRKARSVVDERRPNAGPCDPSTGAFSPEYISCIQDQAALDEALWELERVTRGFPVAEAECIGSGAGDRGGFRFSTFRCKVVVKDRSYHDGYAFGPGINAWGRIVVYTTSNATFRWKAIS